VITDLAGSDEGKSNNGAYLSTAFFLRISLGLVSFILLSLGSVMIGYEGPVRILILIYGLSMLFSFHSRNSLLSSNFIVTERRAVPEVVIFSVTIVTLLFKYWMTVIKAPLYLFLCADAILILGISVIFLFIGVLGGTFPVSIRLFRWDLARNLALRALPLSISALLVSVFLRVDQVMLSRMMDMKAVGTYSVAVKLVEALNFVPVLAASLLLPVFARHRESRNLDSLLRITFRSTSWAALMFIAALTLFGRDLLSFLWQERFLDSLGPLLILSWSSLFVFMGTVNGAMSVAFGLQKYNLVFISVQSFLNVALNLILIPKFGVSGAAISTSITYGLGFLMMFLFPAMHFIAKQAWRDTLPLCLLVAVLLYSGTILNRWWVVVVLILVTCLLLYKSTGFIRLVQRERNGR